MTKCGGARLVPRTDTTPEHVEHCLAREQCYRYQIEPNRVHQQWMEAPWKPDGRCKERVELPDAMGGL